MTGYTFAQLIDVEQVRQLLESHHQLSGMAYGLFDNNENDIVSAGWQDICTKFHCIHPVCSERCRESNAFIKAHLDAVEDGCLEYRCGNGMIDTAMPIVIEGRHLATFFAGQFFYDDERPDGEFFIAQARKYGFDPDGYLAALERVPVFSREHVRANLKFLHSMVRVLAESGLKSLRLLRETESRMMKEHELREQAAERQRHDLHNRLKAFFSSIPDLVWLKDVNGVYLACNPVFERFAGAKEADIVGKTDFDFIDAELARAFRDNDAEAIHSNGVRINEEWITFADTGEHAYLETRKAPVFDRDGEIIGVLGIGRDITGQKRSERQLRQALDFSQGIINAIPDILFEIDRNGRYLNVWTRNPDALAAQKEMLLGRTVHDVLSAENAVAAMKAIGEADEKGVSYGNTIPIVQADGETRWYEHSLAKKRGNTPSEDSFIVLSRDVSARKEAEEALRESERRYRMLADNVHDVVWVADISGRITYISPSVVRFSGFTPRERIGAELVENLTPSSAALVRERLSVYSALILAGQRPEPERLELENRRKDGTVTDIEVNVSAMYDSAGEFAGFMGVTRDITERKRIEEQLHQSQKMEAIGQLAGGIAHDFNNIMTAITGFAHIVGMKLGDSPLNAYLDKILASAERASSLTGDLLAFSRKHVMQFKPIDLRKAIKDSRQLISRLLREDIEFSVSLPDEPFTVMAGENHLTQILMNLAANARDAMPCGGTINIGVVSFSMDRNYVTRHGYGKVGRYALVTFADTGRGMDEKTREKIFEPFFTTKEAGKGTGLGLATVYGIVKQLGGFINVYSESGKGTIFRIYLPLTGGAEPVEDTTQSAIPSAGGTETILLAEDDPDVREIGESILSEAGYKVITARDGAEAIRIFSGLLDSIDLLVLDAVMPDKNGIEVLQYAQKMRPGIKAIMMSGYTPEVMIVNGLIERGLKYLQKPVKPKEFIRTVRETLDA